MNMVTGHNIFEYKCYCQSCLSMQWVCANKFYKHIEACRNETAKKNSQQVAFELGIPF